MPGGGTRRRPARCRGNPELGFSGGIGGQPGAGRREGQAAAGQAAGREADNGTVIDVEPAKFEDMVVAALDSLPEDLGRLMRNVAVTVEHGPGRPGLLGLYQGIPLTSRTSQYAGVLPDRITIYRRAICAICNSEAEVVEQVRRTVIHEVAHHFGIDDARLTGARLVIPFPPGRACRRPLDAGSVPPRSSNTWGNASPGLARKDGA